jgi:hypothetical protein
MKTKFSLFCLSALVCVLGTACDYGTGSMIPESASEEIYAFSRATCRRCQVSNPNVSSSTTKRTNV